MVGATDEPMIELLSGLTTRQFAGLVHLRRMAAQFGTLKSAADRIIDDLAHEARRATPAALCGTSDTRPAIRSPSTPIQFACLLARLQVAW